MGDEREQLATLLRTQAQALECWETAELHLLEKAVRQHLGELGIVADADLAVALMAVAALLTDRAPEWGGNARDALAEVAQLGLRLLEGDDGADDADDADDDAGGGESAGGPTA